MDYDAMQECNLINLPENYMMDFWMYHVCLSGQLPQVAIDESSGKIVGYVLGKMDDEDDDDREFPFGHITSLSVLREYRKLGIATRLMHACHH